MFSITGIAYTGKTIRNRLGITLSLSLTVKPQVDAGVRSHVLQMEKKSGAGICFKYLKGLLF